MCVCVFDSAHVCVATHHLTSVSLLRSLPPFPCPYFFPVRGEGLCYSCGFLSSVFTAPYPFLLFFGPLSLSVPVSVHCHVRVCVCVCVDIRVYVYSFSSCACLLAKTIVVGVPSLSLCARVCVSLPFFILSLLPRPPFCRDAAARSALTLQLRFFFSFVCSLSRPSRSKVSFLSFFLCSVHSTLVCGLRHVPPPPWQRFNSLARSLDFRCLVHSLV